MDFVKVLKTSRFLDPSQGFAETERYSEVRYDPLTGHSTRILNFPIREIAKIDLNELIESSRKFCPFCPEYIELVTPKFHPDLVSKERYARGEALCVPNAFPYDENGAVTVMCHKHYLSLNEFTPQLMTDSLTCCFEYLEDVCSKQPHMVYQSVNWNYMPLAGGSLIHPHLQITASSTPTNYYTGVLSCLARYREVQGTDFWIDYLEEEKKREERMIYDGGTVSWLVAFAPMGIFDIVGIIPDAVSSSDIRGMVLEDLVKGMLNVMRFIDSMNMQSLNMSLYFYLGKETFMPHMRICPRVSIPPYDASQVNYMWMLHKETLTTLKPEDICSGIKPYWA
jgi:UDPglucose--hexose-1-phosphate uridylyltransferase